MEIDVDGYSDQTNETTAKNKSFKKARCHCNGKVTVMYLSISNCFIFCFTLIV